MHDESATCSHLSTGTAAPVSALKNHATRLIRNELASLLFGIPKYIIVDINP